MVNGNQQYLHELYDHVGEIQDEMEMQESTQDAMPAEPYVESYIIINGSLQRIGG